LPWEFGKNAVIAESEFFYAVIVRSEKLMNAQSCDTTMPDAERLELQSSFPNNKVFAMRCVEPGFSSYTSVPADVAFIAVFAGRSPIESARLLRQIKSAGKYRNAYVKRMQAYINGT
jgi:hypothetical protein